MTEHEKEALQRKVARLERALREANEASFYARQDKAGAIRSRDRAEARATELEAQSLRLGGAQREAAAFRAALEMFVEAMTTAKTLSDVTPAHRYALQVLRPRADS